MNLDRFSKPSTPTEIAIQKFIGTQQGVTPEQREAAHLRVFTVAGILGSLSLIAASLMLSPERPKGPDKSQPEPTLPRKDETRTDVVSTLNTSNQSSKENQPPKHP